MRNDILLSLKLCVSSIAVFSGVYTVIVLLFAMVAAPSAREGSLVMDEAGTIRGSRLIGQPFSRPEYFWPRPSAVDYNADGAGGSNLSPADPRIGERASTILAKYPVGDGKMIPAELVTASGSGLDPHISLSAAHLQAGRVTAARGLPLDMVNELIEYSEDSPTLSALGGEPLVNVLLLNLALDQGGK